MTPQTLSILLTVIALLAAAGCLAAAFSSFKRKRTIDDCPTSKTQGVFIGLTELKGTAESDSPLTSYLAGKKCVQYVWQVDEHWSRTVHETYTDAQGHFHSRTRPESGWTKVTGEEKSIPFYLKNDAGIIRIVPDCAKIENI
ncbi:MAG: LemA domain-containing protein, partial [Dehalococcoidales bacterium]|nr:LemA domain-containing protein [Dehalococcoidales bacterium]